MIRLEQIRVNPQALQFANPHPKQETIWSLQYPDGFLKAPLYNYPSPELAVDAWKDILMAHKLAHSTDMVLNDVCDNAMMVMMTMLVVAVVFMKMCNAAVIFLRGKASASKEMTGFITGSGILENSSKKVQPVMKQNTIPLMAVRKMTLQMVPPAFQVTTYEFYYCR